MVDPSNFDFCLEYEELKHYDFNKFRYSRIYKAVLFGPAPHKISVADAKHRNSPNVENQTNYPLTIKICKSTVELKITNNSFADALEKIESHFSEDYQAYTGRTQFANRFSWDTFRQK